MANDVRHPLTSALQRCDELADILKDISLQAILTDRMSQAALEGSLHRVGGVLASASRIDPHVLTAVDESQKLIDLAEHVISHYNEVDHEALWTTAATTVSRLADQVRVFIANLPPQESPTEPPLRVLAPFVAEHREDIAALCDQFGVTRLAVYGSAANGTFKPETSDVDFVVELNDSLNDIGRLYLGRAAALELLMQRSVDLVMFHDKSSHWLRNEVRRTEIVLFERDRS